MSKSFSFRADASDAGQRLDSALANRDAYASRSAAAKACENGSVLVNGNAAAKKYVLKAGDFVYYEVEEALEHIVAGQDIPLDVRFEDITCWSFPSKRGWCAIRRLTITMERW